MKLIDRPDDAYDNSAGRHRIPGCIYLQSMARAKPGKQIIRQARTSSVNGPIPHRSHWRP